MIKLKSGIFTALAAMGAFVASPAFAGHYEIWNGSAWVSTGDSVDLSGPTTASPAMIPVPCTNAVFTLSLPATGTTLPVSPPAKVSTATFGTSTACTSITKVLPWNVSAPDASGKVTISNISIHFTSPNTTCTGSISGTLAPLSPTPPTTNTYGFTGALGPCTDVRSTANPPPSGPAALKSTKPIRWVAVP
ncbi:hypothetical protein [Dokdonella ginsengisoli]|uniref:Secreted protein n=1 Tax=Dokdonella ginsengisoli TaxID=363846 RepID=A0ABV9R034_9GAMM